MEILKQTFKLLSPEQNKWYNQCEGFKSSTAWIKQQLDSISVDENFPMYILDQMESVLESLKSLYEMLDVYSKFNPKKENSSDHE